MTNLALYQLLLSDVQAFNDWRVKNADIRIDFENYDFAGQILTDAVLINANLRNANFTNANIEYVSLCNSDLSGANFSYAIAAGAHFGSIENSDVRLPQTFLAHLSKAAIIIGANFKEADLDMANFRNCEYKMAYFEGANIETATF